MKLFVDPTTAVVVSVAPHTVFRVRVYAPGMSSVMCFWVSPALNVTERTGFPSTESSRVAASSRTPS